MVFPRLSHPVLEPTGRFAWPVVGGCRWSGLLYLFLECHINYATFWKLNRILFFTTGRGCPSWECVLRRGVKRNTRFSLSGNSLRAWWEATASISSIVRGGAQLSVCPTAVKRAKEASLQVKGARLFNLLPKNLRGMKGVTLDTFKANLDRWLSAIPDQPTTAGRQRAALSNSLLDQVWLLTTKDFYPMTWYVMTIECYYDGCQLRWKA